MRIGGFQRLTLVDFPGKVAATVFTQGCNFRCGYCHNPELVLPQFFQESLEQEVVFDFLSGRRGKLEGVVITGGEPTIQKGLTDFMMHVKEMGFALKLDTNGSHPEVLQSLMNLRLIDYIAIDIKSSFEKYPQITSTACLTSRIQESIDLVIGSGLPYQFRTTLVKEFCTLEDLQKIQSLVKKAKHYVLQPLVISQQMIDPPVGERNQYTSHEVELLKAMYDKCQGTKNY